MLKIKRMRVWKTHIHISGTVNASPIAILVYVQRRSKEKKGAREAREKDGRGGSVAIMTRQRGEELWTPLYGERLEALVIFLLPHFTRTQ